MTAPTYDDLHDQLAGGARTTTDQGAAFGHLAGSYLPTAPEFTNRFTEIYLRQDWPGRGRRHDFGIDVVAWETVVAADPDSMSGKAGKARAYGIPIITEDAFAALMANVQH